MVRSLLALSLMLLSPAAVAGRCSPAPTVAPGPRVAANSTYTSDAEPPKRYGYAPHRQIKVTFGQQAVDKMCGRPPCGFVNEACEDSGAVALPDPFTTDDSTFARLVRHELAHVNGWPATHGD